MPFLKKHYEKIILSIVLLGLAVAAASLPLQVSRVREFLDETVQTAVKTPPKPFKAIDLSTNRAVLERLENPIEVKLSGAHNVLNPVTWKKRPDGVIYKIELGNELGAGALEVLRIEPLKLAISFEPDLTGESRYVVTVIRETERNPRSTLTARVNVPNKLFTIVRANGPPEDPTALVIQFKDEKRQITINKGKVYEEVIDYAADLRYPPTKTPFPRKRKDDVLWLDGENYKIVVIDRNQVVLQSDSKKRTILKWNAMATIK